MAKFGPVEQVVVSESNPLLPLPPVIPPLLSPFPVNLPNNGTINLALVNARSRHVRAGTLLSAVVNWSATFTPPAGTGVTLVAAGSADVTFEILLNGLVIYRVTQSILQKAAPSFTAQVTSFNIASLLHFDEIPVLFCPEPQVYVLRAANISLAAPLVSSGTATVTAAVGAVTFVAEKVAVCRDEPDFDPENSFL